MRWWNWITLLLLLLSCGSMHADAKGSFEVNVSVMFDDDRPAGAGIQVQLLASDGAAIAESFTDPDGKAVLAGFGSREFRIHIAGAGIEETISQPISISSSESGRTEVVRVHHKQLGEAKLSQATISATQLAIPRHAKKEFDRGVRDLSDAKLGSARDHFLRAVSEYPHYAAALNDLGILALRNNDKAAARGYFEQAVAIDNRLAEACANLGKLFYQDGRMAEAEPMLERVLTTEPDDVESLLMLANIDLSKARYDAAIAKAAKIDGLPHQKFAVVHLIAAKAFYAEKRTAEAISELKSFLREAPSSPLAISAKQSLAHLSAGL